MSDLTRLFQLKKVLYFSENAIIIVPAPPILEIIQIMFKKLLVKVKV